MTESKFHVGDLVMFSEKCEVPRFSRLYTLLKKKLAGATGVIIEIEQESDRLPSYEVCVVQFSLRSGDQMWHVLSEWLDPVCNLSDSYELNAMFEEIGGFA